VRTEFEHLLAAGGCPVCAHVVEAERSFFSWFEIEYHASAGVQAQLRAALGMCPAHSRRLVEDIGAGPIMSIVMREALAGASRALRDEVPAGSCPACEAASGGADYARHTLHGAVHDAGNAGLYREHVGVCLPHMLDSAETADAWILTLLSEQLLGSLRQVDGADSEQLLAGTDLDAPRRAHWRDLVDRQEDSAATISGLTRSLTTEACPICLAAGAAERRYLQWFGDRAGERDASLGTDPGRFCSEHLHDLALVDRGAAHTVADRIRPTIINELERLLDQLSVVRSATGRRRRSGSDELGRARGVMLTPRPCPACHARAGVERSQLDLLTAALALAPVRRHYEDCHGLCVRHAMRVSAGPAAQLVKRHADARVAVLAWEVQERARKYAWSSRHERIGPEHDAWQRALKQIDGRVFAGGRAPAGPGPTAAESA
jgi:hypothetical protein